MFKWFYIQTRNCQNLNAKSETDIYAWQSWNMHTVAEEGK